MLKIATHGSPLSVAISFSVLTGALGFSALGSLATTGGGFFLNTSNNPITFS